MATYYNEIDLNAAEWLRELMKAGYISDGEVDTRDIRDVVPAELAGFERCHFFAGIGIWDYALNQAGWTEKVWTGSCPCQPFSAAGKGEGFTDERHLWPAWFHLIEQCRPDTLFGEQVSSKDGTSWLDLVHSDLEGIGYTAGTLDIPSASVGAPHIRQRLYFVADAEHKGRNHRGRLEGRRNDYLDRRDAETRRDGNIRRVFINAGADGESRTLADAGHSEHSRRRELRHADAVDGGPPAESEGTEIGRQWSINDTADGSTVRRSYRVENAESIGRREGRSESGGVERRSHASERSSIDDLGDSNRERSQGIESEGRAEGREAQERPSRLPNGAVGTCNGFWSNAEWIYCRDGKYRPVKSSIFPLVTGDSKGLVQSGDSGVEIDEDASPEARVMRLRGYGNAINAENAINFILAYGECRD